MGKIRIQVECKSFKFYSHQNVKHLSPKKIHLIPLLVQKYYYKFDFKPTVASTNCFAQLVLETLSKLLGVRQQIAKKREQRNFLTRVKESIKFLKQKIKNCRRQDKRWT